MQINYDKYSQKYYFNDVKPMTFEQLEVFKDELQAICTDVVSERLAAELGGLGADDCGDACKI